MGLTGLDGLCNSYVSMLGIVGNPINVTFKPITGENNYALAA